MRTLKILASLLSAVMLSACSKTVQWEEEVLLNTGETIWVSKEVRYTIKGQPGNPADMGYLPDYMETLSFKYGGRTYVYTGEARLMVLAISPERLPVLLAPPSWGSWLRNNKFPLCAKPYYVQFIPDTSGNKWTWPDRIELWTYSLPTNLMIDRDHPSQMMRRYTMADKSTRGFWRDPRSMDLQKIDPTQTNQDCPKG